MMMVLVMWKQLMTIPKIIENCELNAGDEVTIKFGKDLAWADVVTP